jgi:hypothetical protein
VVVLDFCQPGHFNPNVASPAKASAVPQPPSMQKLRALAKLAGSDPAAYRKYLRGLQSETGSAQSDTGAPAGGSATALPGVPLDAQGDPAGGSGEPQTGGSSAGANGQSLQATRALLDTIIGPQNGAANAAGSSKRGGHR